MWIGGTVASHVALFVKKTDHISNCSEQSYTSQCGCRRKVQRTKILESAVVMTAIQRNNTQKKLKEVAMVDVFLRPEEYNLSALSRLSRNEIRNPWLNKAIICYNINLRKFYLRRMIDGLQTAL